MRKVMEIRNRCGGILATCALVALWAAAPASASLVTYRIDFSASNLIVGSGLDPAPADPVTGQVTITFDPTVVVNSSTANITLNSLNIALGSAISFSYEPGDSNGFLVIGGIHLGPGEIEYNPSTNDFWLYITAFTFMPTFLQMGYSQTSVSTDNLFYTSRFSPFGSVRVTVVPTAVPEPSSLALGAIGVVAGGFYCGRRRRRKTA